jgi:hypothetical protein
MPQGPLTPIGPRPGQRHLTTNTTTAHKHQVTTPALDEQHLQPLTTQRMKRMRTDEIVNPSGVDERGLLLTT